MNQTKKPDKWLQPRKITTEEEAKDLNCVTCIYVSACETKGTHIHKKICDNYNKGNEDEKL